MSFPRLVYISSASRSHSSRSLFSDRKSITTFSHPNPPLDPFLNTDNISAAIGFSGSNMAALLLSCLGITTSKIRAKQRAKKEREQEYEQNFDFLKEQNANRVRQLSNQGEYQGSMDGRTLYGDGVTDRSPEMQQQHSRTGSTTLPASQGPPKYDDITTEETASRHSG